MKVKDQLRTRRQQLGISVNELAGRMGVSAQAVRYWESGRSFPGKAKTSALEGALSMRIDWTEGARDAAKRPQVASLIDPDDVELLLQIARLPPPAKALVASLVRMHLEATGIDPRAGLERAKESRVRPFNEPEWAMKIGGQAGDEQDGKPHKKSGTSTTPRQPTRSHQARRKTA
jgi:transcriptional regulator with XRE-family HTH domain